MPTTFCQASTAADRVNSSKLKFTAMRFTGRSTVTLRPSASKPL